MSDAASEARNEAEAWDRYVAAVNAFADALEQQLDPMFGLSDDALQEVNFAIARFGLKIERKRT